MVRNTLPRVILKINYLSQLDLIIVTELIILIQREFALQNAKRKLRITTARATKLSLPKCKLTLYRQNMRKNAERKRIKMPSTLMNQCLGHLRGCGLVSVYPDTETLKVRTFI